MLQRAKNNGTEKEEGSTVVYADILFIINFSMDFLVLFGVGRLLGIRSRLFRIVLSGAAGGAYSVLSLLISQPLFRGVSAVAVSFLLCLIAYPLSGRVKYLKAVFLFYSGAVLLGGCVSACYSFLSSLFPDISPGEGMTDIPLGVFAAVAAFSVLLSFITGRLWSRQKSVYYASVTVEYMEKTGNLRLLCDSGNLVTEPISGLPVIVISGKAVDPEKLKNPRFVPIKTASGRRLLTGFVPDRLTVHIKGLSVCVDCVIAMTEENTFSDCDGVIPYILIQELL